MIPDSVLTIDNGAFAYNQEITSIKFCKSLQTIGDLAFGSSKITSVIIPDSVKTVGGGAFSQSQISSVTIGNSVQTIGDHAFYKNQITSTTIPRNVTSIGIEAFNENGSDLCLSYLGAVSQYPACPWTTTAYLTVEPTSSRPLIEVIRDQVIAQEASINVLKEQMGRKLSMLKKLKKHMDHQTKEIDAIRSDLITLKKKIKQNKERRIDIIQ